tara:strand:- start:54 stop:173 length:120 start_codon:yes stop_codon:yes gene_type:complete
MKEKDDKEKDDKENDDKEEDDKENYNTYQLTIEQIRRYE